MVTEQQVRERAYLIWEIEGRQIGQAEVHWLQAEIELNETFAPLQVAAVETTTTMAASPAKTVKLAPKAAKAAKTVEPKALKAKRAPRAKAEQVALH